MSKHLIPESQLRAFSFYHLDDATSAIRNILGVTSGDVAGVVFSGFDWNDASIDDRQAKLRKYVKTECRYASWRHGLRQ